MTQNLAALPIGGGEGCSLRAAADWLREEEARRPQKLSKLLLPAPSQLILLGLRGLPCPDPGPGRLRGPVCAPERTR